MRTKNILFFKLLATSVAFTSCNKDELLNPTEFYDSVINYSVGDTTLPKKNFDSKIYNQYSDRKLDNAIIMHDTTLKFKGVKLHGQPKVAPDISKLKNQKENTLKGKSLQYLAIGSSLTAGVRDGGYYNEAILTSYPEMLARQLKLEDFKSPLFPTNNYNGIGRRVKSNFNPTKGSVQKYAIASNNTAVVGYDSKNNKAILAKENYNYDQLNNRSMPGMIFQALTSYQNTNEDRYDTESFKLGYTLKGKKFDFFTFEAGSAFFLNGRNDELGLLDMRPVEPGEITRAENYHQFFIKNAYEKGMKGVIITTPYYFKFPGYNQITVDEIRKNSNGVINYFNDDNNGYIFGSNTAAWDSIASPVVSLSLKLKNLAFYRPNANGQIFIDLSSSISGYKKLVDNYNNGRIKFAEKYGFPAVHLEELYDKIMRGEYVTHDGIKVNPDWKTGNFFSQDGIFPTAFGHAIIANEIISVMNSHYKTQIPYINTSEYLK